MILIEQEDKHEAMFCQRQLSSVGRTGVGTGCGLWHAVVIVITPSVSNLPRFLLGRIKRWHRSPHGSGDPGLFWILSYLLNL